MNDWITEASQVEEGRWYSVVRLYRPDYQYGKPSTFGNADHAFAWGTGMDYAQCWVMGSGQLRVRLTAGDRLMAIALPKGFNFDFDCRGPVPDLRHIRAEECRQL